MSGFQRLLPYERFVFNEGIWSAFTLAEGELLLIRFPQRWRLDNEVIDGAYEMCSVGAVLELCGCELVFSHGEHIHVVRRVGEGAVS